MNFTLETPDMEIEYEVIDASYGHAYGRYSSTSYEITKIMVYVPALGDWMDVTHLEQFGLIADKLVATKLEKAA